MSDARPGPGENWLLIAAMTILLLLIHRFVQADPKPAPARRAIDSPRAPDRFARELTEPGRGRRAESPWRIPLAGWKDVLWRTYQRSNDDRLLATAAGVVFFGLLAIFPAITALVSFYGLFADPSTITRNLQSLALMLPEGSFQIVQDQIGRVLAKGSGELGATFLFGLVLAIWSANAGMKAVIDALNVAYGEKEKRGFLKLNLTSLTLTIAAIIALVLMVNAVVVLPLALDRLGLQPVSQLVVSLARWPLMFILLVIALAVLYRLGPSRRSPQWEWLGVGTLVAVLLWIAGSAALSWYLSNFANYTATYGSLGAAIGFMMWMWMSAIVVLLGAELNSELERQTVTDTTVGRPKPLGGRDATAADTLGPAVS